MLDFVTAGSVLDLLDSHWPLSSQESWDNSGLLIGSRSPAVTKVMTALDPTPDTARQAKLAGAELVVTHHPVIFHPLRSISDTDAAYAFVTAGIGLISMHTCFDKADDGVSFILARTIGLVGISRLPGSDFLFEGGVDSAGAPEFAARLKEILGGPVRYNDNGRNITSAAVCGGAGCSLMDEIYGSGIDAFITGDASHHDFLDAAMHGVSLFACGHFETENPAVDRLGEVISGGFGGRVTVLRAGQSSPIETQVR